MSREGCKKVLIVMSPILRGGMELQIYEILRLLDRHLFEPFICTVRYHALLQPSEVDRILQKEYRNLASRVYEIPTVSVYDPHGVWSIIKIIKENEIAIVYSNTVIWAQIAGMLSRTPIVQHVRGEIGALDAPKLSSFANFYTCRFSKAVIAESAAVKEQIATHWHVDRSIIHVIHSGIDIVKFNPRRINDSLDLRINIGIGATDKVIITIGNARPVKGYQYFVQMASEISQHRPNVRFVLVGAGPSLEELKSQVHALGLQEHVLFLGRRADIPQLLAIADVFVITSLNEAGPGSVKEAMAMELPVVATDVGGLPEIVREGASGFLVPPRDPQAIAERVNWLLDNPERAKEFGRRGREIASEKFTNVQMVRRVEQVYKDVLGIPLNVR